MRLRSVGATISIELRHKQPRQVMSFVPVGRKGIDGDVECLASAQFAHRDRRTEDLMTGRACAQRGVVLPMGFILHAVTPDRGQVPSRPASTEAATGSTATAAPQHCRGKSGRLESARKSFPRRK